jgi:hypothetical protein
MSTVIWVLIGAFVGWNLPQPFWAKAIQTAIVKKWNDFTAKK